MPVIVCLSISFLHKKKFLNKCIKNTLNLGTLLELINIKKKWKFSVICNNNIKYIYLY